MIFGRAGEEIEALRQANVEYEIVPGVTAALGAAAVAGIPLTHRHASSTLVFTAGHHAAENEDADWSRCAETHSTLVVYMPGSNYTQIASRLTAAGFAEDTPCAIISQATTPGQHVHRTTIFDLRRAPKLAAPTLLMIGDLVRFADRNSIQQATDVPDLQPEVRALFI